MKYHSPNNSGKVSNNLHSNTHKLPFGWSNGSLSEELGLSSPEIWKGVVTYNHSSICINMYMHYSGTPLFRTSEMRTYCFNGRFAPVWIAFPLTAIHYNP